MTVPVTRLLVVDDSPEFLSFMETLLTSEGFKVRVASSAEAARASLAAEAPNLVISDVRMPGLEPFGMLELLRRDPRTRDVPVLLCTGALQEVDQASPWLHERGIEVLLKPFDIEELLARIHRLSSAAPH